MNENHNELSHNGWATSLASFTPPGSDYPPFISISRTEDKKIQVIVRSPKNADGSCGGASYIQMEVGEFLDLVLDAEAAIYQKDFPNHSSK